jgi:hypothetical protein
LLTTDLELANAPELIKDSNIVLRLNGKRPMSVIHANAYGWVIKGAKDRVGCRNKRRGEDVTQAQFVMPPDVRARLVERLSAEKSPIEPTRTLMEEIEVKADELFGADEELAKEAKTFLERVAIFPRPSAETSFDAFITYEGLRYWTIKGREIRQERGGHKPILFNDGRREPTLRDYRRATITRQVLELFANTTKGSQERADGLMEIATKHDQSTDQSKAYADWAYQLEAEREALEDYAAEEAAMKAHEKVVIGETERNGEGTLDADLAHLADRPKDLAT